MPQWGHPRSGASVSPRAGRDATYDAVRAQEDLWI